MIVIDTNVLSEMLKDTPSPAVVRWYKSVPMQSCFATTITQAEMLAGAAVLPDGKRRAELIDTVAKLFEEDFADRVLAFDTRAAYRYAEIMLQRRQAGMPISALDAQIAAIAREKDMAVATRNIRDFIHCGINVIDPWAS